jgi:hypothetical protein
MENPLHPQMLERCKTLVTREVEIAQEERKLELEKRQIQAEFQAAKAYALTSHDPAIRRGLQKLSEYKKQLMSPAKQTQKVVETKSHLIIRTLQQHGQDGLDADEIMALLPSEVEIDRNYVVTILGNLRKKGKATKDRNKFFIVPPGQKPTTPLHLVKNSEAPPTAA